jgi:hypothetical protein
VVKDRVEDNQFNVQLFFVELPKLRLHVRQGRESVASGVEGSGYSCCVKIAIFQFSVNSSLN